MTSEQLRVEEHSYSSIFLRMFFLLLSFKGILESWSTLFLRCQKEGHLHQFFSSIFIILGKRSKEGQSEKENLNMYTHKSEKNSD